MYSVAQYCRHHKVTCAVFSWKKPGELTCFHNKSQSLTEKVMFDKCSAVDKRAGRHLLRWLINIYQALTSEKWFQSPRWGLNPQPSDYQWDTTRYDIST